MGILLMPLWGVAQDEKPVEQILECAAANVPPPGNIRAVRLTARDRIGSKRITRLRIHAHRSEEGQRRVLVQFVEPQEMVGASLLLMQADDETRIYYMSPELDQPKRLTGAERTLELFGTDFSYEDFERLEAVNRPGASERLEDAVVAGRPVYVVHTFPADRDASDYGAVLTHFDQETCAPLKVEMYDRGGVLRKQLLADPGQVLKRGEAWIPHQALMQDLVDFTETQMLVESVEFGTPTTDEQFSPEGLKASAASFRRASPSAP